MITVVQVFYSERVFTDFFKIKENADISQNTGKKSIKLKQNASMIACSHQVESNRQEDLNQKYLGSIPQEKYLSSTQKIARVEQDTQQTRDMNKTQFDNFQQYNQFQQSKDSLMDNKYAPQFNSQNTFLFDKYK